MRPTDFRPTEIIQSLNDRFNKSATEHGNYGGHFQVKMLCFLTNLKLTQQPPSEQR